jgi:putative flippase GtrA
MVQNSFGWQLLRFLASGVVATAIDLTVLNLFLHFLPNVKTVFGLDSYFAWKTLSFATAATYSYFASKYFTFRTPEEPKAREVSKFALVSLVSFFVNVLVPVGVFTILSGKAGLSHVLLANVASLTGTALSLVINFFGYKYIVFKK